MFTAVVLVASLAGTALANIFITNPVASTTFTGGQTAQVTWMDDGNQPSLSAFGAAEVGIFVGNALQQSEVQQIVPSVDVSTTGTIQFTINPSAGENGAFYFIRFQSLALKDATSPQFPAEAFSAKFTLTGMTGTFTTTEQQQINGTSTAPIGGAPTSSSSSGASSTSSTSSSTTTTHSSSSPSASNTSAAVNKNGAERFATSGTAGVAAVAAALFALVL